MKELKELIDSGDLRVELKVGRPSSMVLKGTYGEKIHKIFGMTRQGVRWRFQHIFGREYVEAFEAVLFIEKIFGSQLREYAMRISREKYSLRQKMLNLGLPKAKNLLKK
ncbi:MAG: hypothetical protein Q7T18_11285 [Sedimentisphaerales bacterium]|nr:hypothetical protein [Sedimentisphaerales bacterium]